MADPSIPVERSVLVAPGVRVPRHELEFRASRAGGPGGQHVNTSSTRVELRWSVPASAALTTEQRDRLLRRLGRRVDSAGVLRIVADTRRSQLQNREAAVERFQAIVAEALRVPKPRRATRPTRGSKEARLAAKRRRSGVKRERRVRDDD
ncbi:MAG TPA: alternative ribosome rescue aminoacyl-tRNA hydrolase ArfB [Gemmatimonadales bacterium]|jgi:ribosome-associated protein|nr:alternative ribosome rescue aminoacyl-tRNA hydrolase ArfB [Gemmatimonadales bacterium]